MNWLRELLDLASSENMCVQRGCTTCGATAFRDILLARASRNSSGDSAVGEWSPDALKALVRALAELDNVEPEDEEAVRFIIMHLHDRLGDAAFLDAFAPGFSTSPAAEVLQRMRSHHVDQLARRAAHDYRNSAEGIVEARARRKVEGERRATEHRARKAAREAGRLKSTNTDR